MERNANVLLFQGPNDAEVIRQITGRLDSVPIVADTSLSLGHLAALMKRCHLFIVADSGPRHLAARVGARTLALFRRNHSSAWRIYSEEEGYFILESTELCPHCPAGRCADRIPAHEVYGAYCLRKISVEEVLSKVREILD